MPREQWPYRCTNPCVDTLLAAGERSVILLAHSNVLIRNLLAAALAQEGYFVLSAATGAEAVILATACGGQIHLVITSAASRDLGRGVALARVILLSPATEAGLSEAAHSATLRAGLALSPSLGAAIRQALTDPGLPREPRVV